jgi:hypothetical protein
VLKHVRSAGGVAGLLAVLADDVPNHIEDTGLGFKMLAKIPAEETVTETTCEMERPS